MKRQMLFMLAVSLLIGAAIAGCSADDKKPNTEMSKIKLDGPYFKDERGRYIFFNGVNVAGDTKVPMTKEPDPISYKGRPFPLEDTVENGVTVKGADHWFALLKANGINSIRLLTNWEAVEHEGRGKFDEDYLDYFGKIVEKANKHGIYVLVNFHENMFSRYFHSNFTEQPDKEVFGEPGGLTYMLGSIVPKTDKDAGVTVYDGDTAGDGAPRWAIEACAMEKDIDAPSWGMFKTLGGINLDTITSIVSDIGKITGSGSGGLGDSQKLIDYLKDFVTTAGMKEGKIPFEVYQTNDMMPWTFWGMNVALSVDVEKCYAALFAGHKAFPKFPIDKFDSTGKLKNIKEYLQGTAEEIERDASGNITKAGGLAGAWAKVVNKVKTYPNVIGYDMLNEPPGIFIVLSVMSVYLNGGLDITGVQTTLEGMLGKEKGDAIYRILTLLNLIPVVPEKVAPVINDDVKTVVKHALATLSAKADYPTPSAQEIADAKAAAKTEFEQIFASSKLPLVKSTSDADIKPEYTKNAIIAAKEKFYADAQAIIEAAIDELVAAKPAVGSADSAVDSVWASTYNEKTKFLAINNYLALTKIKWGLEYFDALGSIDLNSNFSRGYLLDAYRNIGKAILKEDPNAILWLEEGGTPSALLGSVTGGNMSSEIYMPKEFSENNVPVVWSPHWYPDIYPYPGFVQPPRQFVWQEWTMKDFSPNLASKVAYGRNTMGNVPIVFGEFGTYFNFNWNLNDQASIDADIKANNYRISAEILDNYYESYEKMFQSRMVWCFSARNSYTKGDLWDHEDFSIVGPDGKPRADKAWVRPYAMKMSGKPKATHFYSDFHDYTPDEHKGDVIPWHEFYLEIESKETDAPTEIFVPRLQYPDGFYVWLSDGRLYFDSNEQILFYYPTNDEPGATHTVTIRPPLAGQDEGAWSYYFDADGKMLVGERK